jgi:hypothetical protein
MEKPAQTREEPMFTLTALSCIPLALAAPVPKPAAYTPVAAATVKEYKALGFEAGVYRRDCFWWLFVPEPVEPIQGDIPAFRTETMPAVKLPAVTVPFGLCFDWSDFNDDDFKQIAHLDQLTVLSLRKAPVKTIPVELPRKLTDLDLFETPLEAGALDKLVKLDALQFLNLDCANVNDDWLARCAGFKQLTSLSVGRKGVTDAGMKHVAGMQNLEFLDASRSSLTDEGWAAIGGMKRLKYLVAIKTELTDRGLAEICKCQTLTSLQLAETNVTGKGVNALPNLEWLFLDRSRVDDDGLRSVFACKRLTALSLRHTIVSDRSLAGIGGLDRLEDIDIRGTKISPVGERWLKKTLPKCAVHVDER